MLFTIDTPSATLPPSHNKAALVTIVIGNDYIATWNRLCRKGWEFYANVRGYDIILITQPLDTSERAASRSPAWQKLLILSQSWSKHYERIVWLDADIIINPVAENILEYAADVEKIGISTSGARLSHVEKHLYYERIYGFGIRPDKVDEFLDIENRSIFSQYDITSGSVMYNTGVLVLSPEHHEALFQEIYALEDKGRLYEQPYLSDAIWQRGLAHEISARFNWGIFEAIVLYVPDKLTRSLLQITKEDFHLLQALILKEFKNSYFMHFYGCMGLMQVLDNGESLRMPSVQHPE